VNLELDAETKCSNGMIEVLFALYNGASAVIVTGINPHSNGHIYNSANLTRKHTRFDRDILIGLLRQGYPIYTADRQVRMKSACRFGRATKNQDPRRHNKQAAIYNSDLPGLVNRDDPVQLKLPKNTKTIRAILFAKATVTLYGFVARSSATRASAQP